MAVVVEGSWCSTFVVSHLAAVDPWSRHSARRRIGRWAILGWRLAVGATAGVVRVVAGGGLLGGEIFARGLATLFALANILARQAKLDAVRARSLAIALGS